MGSEQNIVLVSNSLWNLVNYRKSLIEKLAMNHRVTLVAPYDHEIIIHHNVNYVCWEVPRTSFDIKTNIWAFVSLYFILRKVQPDYLLTFTVKPNIFAGLLNLVHTRYRYYPNVSGLGELKTNRSLKFRLLKKLYAMSVSRAQNIYLQNDEDAKFLGLKRDKCVILPGSGVDLNRFKFSHRNYDKITKFLFAARLLKSKGLPVLVQAIKNMYSEYNVGFSMTVVGILDEQHPHGIQESELISWHNAGWINYAGSTNEIEQFLEDADCVVLPTFYGEGTPKVLLEALAVGCAIITTNTAGARDTVIRNSNGYLSEPNDVQSLQLALENYIFLDRAQKASFSRCSRQLAIDKFDERYVLEEYDLIFSKNS